MSRHLVALTPSGKTPLFPEEGGLPGRGGCLHNCWGLEAVGLAGGALGLRLVGQGLGFLCPRHGRQCGVRMTFPEKALDALRIDLDTFELEVVIVIMPMRV